MIVGISAIPIGRIRMTNEELAGRVPPALIPLCAAAVVVLHLFGSMVEKL